MMERPLFYRLSDPQPGKDVLNRESIMQMVAEEVQRIVSTKYVGEERHERTVLNYGVPSVVQTGTYSSGDTALLVRHIKEAIEEYEPRLRNVHVELTGAASWDKRSVKISADISIGDITERFTLNIDHN